VRKIVIGLSLPLSGEYEKIGLQIEAALQLFASEINAAGGIELAGERHALELEYRDDRSRRDSTREIYRWLCFERRVDVIFGPYSTALTRVAAAVADEAGMVLINHGGAGDDLYEVDDAADRVSDRSRMIVGVLSPASDYMTGFVRLLATLKFWRKRLAIVAAKTPFARAVAGGAERDCRQRRIWLHGVRLRLKYSTHFDPHHTPDALAAALRRNRINAIISAGSYDHDLAIMKLCGAPAANIPVLTCVAAGVTRDLTDALSQNTDTPVVPAATAAAYRGKVLDLGAVGRDHQVQFALTGNTRRQDGRVIVAATLYETAEQRPVWSQRFDRPANQSSLPCSISAIVAGLRRLCGQSAVDFIDDPRDRLFRVAFAYVEDVPVPTN